MQDELESYKKTQAEKNNFWWTIEFSVPVSENNMSQSEELLSTVAALSDSIGSYIFTENDFFGIWERNCWIARKPFEKTLGYGCADSNARGCQIPESFQRRCNCIV